MSTSVFRVAGCFFLLGSLNSIESVARGLASRRQLIYNTGEAHHARCLILSNAAFLSPPPESFVPVRCFIRGHLHSMAMYMYVYEL